MMAINPPLRALLDRAIRFQLPIKALKGQQAVVKPYPKLMGYTISLKASTVIKMAVGKLAAIRKRDAALIWLNPPARRGRN